jgi:hypothetical protein
MCECGEGVGGRVGVVRAAMQTLFSFFLSMASRPPRTHAPPGAAPLEEAVARALALLDTLTDEGRAASHHVERMRSADLDDCAAIAFLESTRAGLGLVCGLGKGFVIAKVPGKRGWWSPPLAIRALHISVGASAGWRSTSALLTLDAASLARLVTHRAGPAVRLSPGAALAVSCPCAGGSASRDESFEFGLAAADYRVPGPAVGLMADFSVGVTFLTRAPAAASAALLSDGGGGDGGVSTAPPPPPPPAATVLSGAIPTPQALRPLCRALNAAAHLPDRPAAPWPAASPAK